MGGGGLLEGALDACKSVFGFLFARGMGKHKFGEHSKNRKWGQQTGVRQSPPYRR